MSAPQLSHKTLILLGIVFFIHLTAVAQLNSRKEIKIPDIPGYLTLKCDLHMHTVFSDGNVWPTVRADEAWREGIDAIAITDHVEYHPHEADIPVSFGRPYEIVKPRADIYDLLVINSAEITRAMPPGHFNCLFLDDVAALDKDDFWEAIGAAAEQGAFIMWNHPGWRQPDEIPIWYDEHTRLYENRMMHGMEIVNESSYYPLAHEWCIEKEITILGNTDIHNPIHMDYAIGQGSTRTITLVFATERTLDAIKEALFVGRTAVYSEDRLLGDKQFLKPIFESSIEIAVNQSTIKAGKAHYVQITNHSQVPFKLKAAGKLDGYTFPDKIVLYPERTVILDIRNSSGAGLKAIKLPYTVENLIVAPGKSLSVQLEIQP